ncbi:ATP-binding cassette domain-containing protein [Bifidobacterium parmae]|uniref:ABC transporter ATP-binding protein n=1 Tax=Bifidobacterium parmae TaxID=361854 RepID=A0A2N5J582_9BIFI|nr:ATP-binding cassette domain-containing protein [Bifidobacterium parmae]PLS29381.1 ABC transporter ATP-binding protein [Bifidobacterium parmae]
MSEQDIDKTEPAVENDDITADDIDAQPVEFSVVYDEDDDAADTSIAFAIDDLTDADAADATDDELSDAVDDDAAGESAPVSVSDETDSAGDADAADAGETDDAAEGDATAAEPAETAETTDTTDTTADKAADANPKETSAAATAANARRVNETLALAAKNHDVSASADPNEIKASTKRSERALDRQVGDRVLLKSYPTFSLNHATTTNRKTGRHVLDNVSLACYAGSLYAIRVLPDADDPEQRVTLMEVLGGYQLPTSGTAMTKSSNLAELEINELRGHRLGIVPQRYAVRGDLDAEANVRYAMDASGRTYLKPKPVIARELLDRVGFSEATSGRPLRELPLVEQRRVAIARAISCEADVVILDEPTKGLEADDAAAILDLLASIAHARDPKRAVIVVTSSDEVVQAADEVFSLTR